MSHPHNDEEWSARRAKYSLEWKEKQQAKKCINLTLMLPILLRNQLTGTFP